jgi:biopolymer transport protein ExbD
MRRQARRGTGREPTIALINIVFLMLIFFLVAGTLAPPLEGTLRLVRTAELEGATPPDALVIRADGALVDRGQPVAEAAAWWATREGAVARLVPDRALPAATLVRIGRELRAAGAARVVVVTERGLP